MSDDTRDCDCCGRPFPRHTVYANADDDPSHGVVHIEPNDPRDPFALLNPQPKPLTDIEAGEMVRALGEMSSDGHCERWEATRRRLVAESRRLLMGRRAGRARCVGQGGRKTERGERPATGGVDCM